MSVREYYDRYSVRQQRVGINRRHRAIQKWLRQFGLAPGSDVLEIGCGVGTQTELIAADLAGSGILVSVDLSPRSVELARERVARHPNVQVIAADILELKLERRFDVVVMPDVLEHIPIERHARLFALVRSWLKGDGWVLVHMPNPLFLEWCHIHRPDLLQMVDQPIATETLLASAVPHGFYIHFLSTYAIWSPECDYQVILLKARPRVPQFRLIEERARPYARLRAGILGGLGRLRDRVRMGRGSRDAS